MYPIPQTQALTLDPLRLAAERGRLVRFCSRQVGSGEMAEDLAQETLVIAWQQRHTLRNHDAWVAWLNGIARNVCLRYLHRKGVEQERLVAAEGDLTTVSFDTLADTSLPDLDEVLMKEDLHHLLDRALARIPVSAHSLLIERYVDELPIEEIATRRGIRQETATVQLHRSRHALKRALAGPGIREEAISLGLIPAPTDQLEETRLWCPICGKHRLKGYRGPSSKDQNWMFMLACPECHHPHGHLILMHNRKELEDLKGYKPAMNRLNRWWWDFLQEAWHCKDHICHSCGRPSPSLTTAPLDFPFCDYRGERGLFRACTHCGKDVCAIRADEIAFHAPQVQKFWQQHPRLRTTPSREVTTTNGKLLIVRFESVTTSETIEVALRDATMEIDRVLT